MQARKLSDVMQKVMVTAKPGTTLKKAYELMRANKIGKLPLVDKKGRIVGLYSIHCRFRTQTTAAHSRNHGSLPGHDQTAYRQQRAF